MTLESYLTELKSSETQLTSENLSEIAWGLHQLCVNYKKKFDARNKQFAFFSVV